MKVRGREILKFVSGAAFAGSIANAYLWLTGTAVPLLGHTISPGVLGARAVLQLAVFAVCFYLAWVRPTRS